jgi:HlyD family secretion protein
VLQTQASVRETEDKLSRFARVLELSGGRVPSQLEMDAAKAALERARADEAAAKAAVSQAQATLDVNLTDLSKAVIRSPINGVVLKRSVEPGQTVAASFQAPVLFTLAEDLTEMELHVNVDEADVGKVNSGQEATFTVDAYQDRSFPARISKVRFGSQTVEGVVTYETVLKVDNTDRSLRPGMTANAVITVNKIENALLIANAALRFSPPAQQQGGSSGRGSLVSRLIPRPPAGPAKQDDNVNKAQKPVWILRNGQLEPVTVTTGATDGIMTEVTEGSIEPGTALVIDIATGK